jgi:hypothetical protein
MIGMASGAARLHLNALLVATPLGAFVLVTLVPSR